MFENGNKKGSRASVKAKLTLANSSKITKKDFF